MLQPLQLQSLVPMEDVDIADWWLLQRRRVDLASRPLFDSLLLLVAWSIWKERNARVFWRTPASVLAVVRAAFTEGEDWAMAGFAPMVALSNIWSQNNVVM